MLYATSYVLRETKIDKFFLSVIMEKQNPAIRAYHKQKNNFDFFLALPSAVQRVICGVLLCPAPKAGAIFLKKLYLK